MVDEGASALVATWNLHTTQPNYFAPTYSEVVNLTGLLKKRIKRIVWIDMFVCGEVK
jgi:hypothetical protein